MTSFLSSAPKTSKRPRTRPSRPKPSKHPKHPKHEPTPSPEAPATALGKYMAPGACGTSLDVIHLITSVTLKGEGPSQYL